MPGGGDGGGSASEAVLRDFFLGFVRLHVLYHAGKEPVCGVDLMAELERHGYQLTPGTMYPLLHGLERAGLLRSRPVRVAGRRRRYYRQTPAGARVLEQARRRLPELVGEVIGDVGPRIGPGHAVDRRPGADGSTEEPASDAPERRR